MKARLVALSAWGAMSLALACLLVMPSEVDAQDYQGKLTLGIYSAGDQTTVDVNARYSVNDVTAWVGGYGPQEDVRQARAGIEYDLHRPKLLLIPSAQIASESFLGASIYSETGDRIYLVAGASRTNLKPYVNLNFDPNESWQLGGGAHFRKSDSLAAFTVWDNRLHTAQQNSHAVLKHYFDGPHRLTVDVSYKSGRGDEGVFVRGVGASTEFDWRRWFVKGARDGHANFGPDTMWRFGGGVRF